MKQKILNYGIFATLALVCSMCTNVSFDNPIDKSGTSYVGDSLAAADPSNDGKALYYTTIGPVNTDKTPPVITFWGGDSLFLTLNDPRFAKDSVTARDNVDGNLTSSIHWSPEVYTSSCSTFVVTYTVSDKSGNTANKTRVIIIDCEGPVITLLGKNPDTIAVGKTYTNPGATAFDKISGTATVTQPSTPNTSAEGVDTLNYTAMDRAGNVSVKKRVLVVYKPAVVDNTPPVITLRGSKDTTIKTGTTWTDPGYSASDDIDGNITNAVVVTGGTFSTLAPNVFTITYTVSDKAGNNAAPQTRIVRVVKQGTGPDVTPPVIVLKGKSPDSVKVGTGIYKDPGWTATDDVDGDVSQNVTVTDFNNNPITINLNVPGVYTLVYSVSDKAGNKASVTRVVYVVGVSTDHTAPVINLTGAVKCTLNVGTRYVDPGYSATDDVDGNITNKVVRAYKNSSAASVDSNTFFTAIGQYSITYSVSDAAGNPTSAMRNILVQDTTGSGASLTKKYGVPLSSALPSVNAAYKTTPTVDGKGGPNLSTVTAFSINWDLGNKGLYQFSFGFSGPPNYVNFTVSQTFAQASPGFTLTNSGVAGLDGSYYIAATTAQCVWVKTDGSFAIVFKP